MEDWGPKIRNSIRDVPMTEEAVEIKKQKEKLKSLKIRPIEFKQMI